MFEISSLIFKKYIQTCSLYAKLYHPIKHSPLSNLSNVRNIMVSSSRATMIIRRRFPVPLRKEENKPRMWRYTFHYYLEENTETSKPESEVQLILTSYVSGLGHPGDIITMKKTKAYHNYLLPGLAEYPSPENLERARQLKKDEEVQQTQLTLSVERCISILQRHRRFYIEMNNETDWTLEPWHVRTCLRRAGIYINSEKSIELPKQPITGPNMDLEGKEFTVKITINQLHQVKVQCSIYHWSKDRVHPKLYYGEDQTAQPFEKLFPEDDLESSTSP